MEVRLAYEQGCLRTRNPNPFQRWALSYWIYMDRRVHMDDVRSIQELQTFELFPDRWRALHLPGYDNETIGGEEYEGVKEFYPSDIDAFLARVERGEFAEMSGAEVDPGVYGLEV